MPTKARAYRSKGGQRILNGVTTDSAGASASATSAPTAGRALVRAGLILFAIGLVAIVVAVVPFFAGKHDWPLWLNIVCMCAPLGLILAVAGVWRGGRADARNALRNI